MSDSNKDQRHKSLSVREILRTLEEHSKFSSIGRPGIYLNIPPSTLFGFRRGNHLDFQKYEEIGMRHPKADDGGTYYQIGSSHKEAPKFAAIMHGIERNMRIDSPILVWLYEHKKGEYEIVVLDGATRSSSIGYLVEKFPGTFKTVPVEVFIGTKHAAIVEMTRRNLPGRSRDLTSREMVRQAFVHASSGVSHDRIAEMLSLSDASQVGMLIKIGEKASHQVLEAYFDRRISLKTAYEISKRNELEQQTFMDGFQGAEKIPGAETKKLGGDDEVDVTRVRTNVSKAITIMGKSWSAVKDMETLDPSLSTLWNKVETALRDFEEAFSSFEKTYAESKISEPRISFLQQLNEDHSHDEDVRPRLNFDQWRDRYDPIEPKEPSGDDLPPIVAPWTVSANASNEELVSEAEASSKLWSVLNEDDGSVTLAFGRLDGALAYVLCNNPGNVMSADFVILEDLGSNEAEVGSAWELPDDLDIMDLQEDLAAWQEISTDRPQHPDKILAALTEAGVDVAKMIGDDLDPADTEMARRFEVFLDWASGQKAVGRTFRLIKLKSDERGSRYSIGKIVYPAQNT